MGILHQIPKLINSPQEDLLWKLICWNAVDLDNMSKSTYLVVCNWIKSGLNTTSPPPKKKEEKKKLFQKYVKSKSNILKRLDISIIWFAYQWIQGAVILDWPSNCWSSGKTEGLAQSLFFFSSWSNCISVPLPVPITNCFPFGLQHTDIQRIDHKSKTWYSRFCNPIPAFVTLSIQ